MKDSFITYSLFNHTNKLLVSEVEISLYNYFSHFSDEKEKKSDEGSSSPSKSRASPGASPEPRPVERQIEARNPEETISSMVRCLYFANTFVTNGKYLLNAFRSAYDFVIVLVDMKRIFGFQVEK